VRFCRGSVKYGSLLPSHHFYSFPGKHSLRI
jgi:hypothetical protein